MAFYAGKRDPAPEHGEPDASSCSPTATTSTTSSSAPSPAASELLRQTPVQADDRDDLRELLAGRLRRRRLHHDPEVLARRARATRYPLLSDRRNIVVIADEAHRSQYDFIDGFARHTARRAAQRLVHRLHRHADRDDRHATPGPSSATTSTSTTSSAPSRTSATVPIYYESRLAKLELNEPRNAQDRRRVRGGHRRRGGRAARRSSRRKWAALEAWSAPRSGSQLVAARPRRRTSRSGSRRMDGKAMIVCMSRRICVDLYDAIVALRPEWHRRRRRQGR